LLGLLPPADDKDDVAKELKKFDGTWVATSGEANGQALSNDVIKVTKMVVKDGKATFRVADLEGEGTLKLDPAKKPKEIDGTVTSGPETIKGKVSLGIYEFDGDTLKHITASPGTTTRPKDFKTENTEFILIVWKREKK